MLMVVLPSILLMPLFRGGFTKPLPMPLMSQSQLLLTLRGKQSKVQHVPLKLRMLLSKLAFDPEMVQLQLYMYQVLPLPLLLPPYLLAGMPLVQISKLEHLH